jgi:hypothetical protein
MVKRIVLSGLDTMIQSHPLVYVPSSNFTFESMIQLERLGIQVDATISVKREVDNVTRSTSVTINTEIENPSASLVTCLILNKEKLGNIQLGQLSTFKNIFISLLQSSDLVKIVSLNLNVSEVSKLTVSGFKTQVENDTSSAILGALLDMFKVAASDAANGYVKSFLKRETEKIIDKVPKDYRNTTDINGLVNFPDLLLAENEAIRYGGSGNSPYGNVVHIFHSALKKEVLKEDPTDGLSRVNKAVIDPITKLQSNESGSLLFPHVFEKSIRINIGDVNGQLYVRFFGATVKNINSIKSSTLLLDPLSPNEVGNYVGFEHINASISAQIKFVLNGKQLLLVEYFFTLSDGHITDH